MRASTWPVVTLSPTLTSTSVKIPVCLKFTFIRPTGKREPVPLTTEVTEPRSAVAVRIVAAAGGGDTGSRALRPLRRTPSRPGPVRPQTGLGRGPTGHDLDDQHPRFLTQAKLIRRAGGQRLTADAEPGVQDGHALLQRGQQGRGAIDGDGEADAHVPLDRALDRIIDADQLATTIEQRATGVPGVDGRVGLDHAGEGPSIGSGRAAIQARDDAGRERALQAERRADGECGVATLKAIGVAQRQRMKLVR